MKLFDKLLRWYELRVRLKAAEEAGMELGKENCDLRVENILLRREIEQLTNDEHAERLRGEGEPDEA